MRKLFIYAASAVCLSVASIGAECTVESNNSLNIHYLNECDFKIHLKVSSDEWCRLVAFIYPRDKNKKDMYPRFITQYFSNKDALNIAKSLEKCSEWAKLTEENELGTNKIVGSYYAPLESNPRKYIFKIYFNSVLNDSKIFETKTSSYIMLYFHDPNKGKMTVRISVEEAQKLASIFREVPELEKEAKEQAAKADTILK